MSADTDKLREMIGDAESESENLADSISQVEDTRDETNDRISAVQNGMCGVAQTDLTDYLTNTKLPQFQLIQPTAILEFGATYGTIVYSTGNITDWEIYYMTVPVFPAVAVKVVLYAYEGIGWDSDAQIIAWVNDYAFGNDYLTRPLDTGATYGLIPYKDNLNSAISILNNNKDKVEDSVSYLEGYAS
jgi:hypothetical protein